MKHHLYYRLECRFPGPNLTLESTLMRLIGRRPDAEGYDFKKKERNLNWIFRHQRAAEKARQQLEPLHPQLQCRHLLTNRKIDCVVASPMKLKSKTHHRQARI